MRIRPWIFVLIITSLCFPFVPNRDASAQAGTVSFSTSITYQNISTEVAHPTILFYQTGAEKPITIPRPDLAPGASATISVGSLSVGSVGFKGSAMVKSDVPMTVIMTLIPDTTTVKARPIAAGASTGTSDFWFMDLQRGDVPSIITIQNVDSQDNDIRITFIGESSTVEIIKTDIPVGGSVYLNLADQTELAANYYSAAHVTANRSGTSNPGSVIGVQSSANTPLNTAIEGFTQPGMSFGMPIAMCAYTAGLSTSYFVFNTNSTEPTVVTSSYSNGKSEKKTLQPMTGQWFHACSPSRTKKGFYGHGSISSSKTDVLVKGMMKNIDVASSYLSHQSGTNRLALPYVTYSASLYTSQKRQQTTISIMNLGATLNKDQVKVSYYDKSGKLIGTHKLGAISSKGVARSSPASIGLNEFGYYNDGTTGGSVIIEGPAGSNLMAVAWISAVTGKNKYTGELYNAIPAGLQ